MEINDPRAGRGGGGFVKRAGWGRGGGAGQRKAQKLGLRFQGFGSGQLITSVGLVASGSRAWVQVC